MILQEKIKKKAEGYGKFAPVFLEGAKFVLENQWISVDEDLPCNHKELIDEDGDSQITKVIIVRYKDNSVAFARMVKHEGQWKFLGRVTHWMPIPKLSKE